MTRFLCFLFVHLCALLLACGAARAAETPDPHPVIKRPFDLPPSATLEYRITARQSGIELAGSAVVRWQADSARYSVSGDTRAALFGKILDVRSEGAVDAYGLAPAEFAQKRFRKPQTVVRFDRETQRIVYPGTDRTYPLQGGEQDRTSIIWQLIAIARAAPREFKTGSTWAFFVAGPNDAERWEFTIAGREKIKTPQGAYDAVHLFRSAPPGGDQKLDIWLAPSLEWYPVRLRFTEPDGDTIEQSLAKVRH
ncbi:MAG: DUF3108 domain-containing protein [Burkholderiaceae bacterium]